MCVPAPCVSGECGGVLLMHDTLHCHLTPHLHLREGMTVRLHCTVSNMCVLGRHSQSARGPLQSIYLWSRLTALYPAEVGSLR